MPRGARRRPRGGARTPPARSRARRRRGAQSGRERLRPRLDQERPALSGVSWERYAGGPVAGDVRVSRADRDLHAYLPPSYERSDRRFPGLYMHDGQNLFDATTSFAGEWGVDETMEELAVEGLEAIVIGIPHGEDRVREYTPFNGGGDEYL